ncbi:MAG: lysophospholipid acyltransferase family protein [Anaerolineales bacterium]
MSEQTIFVPSTWSPQAVATLQATFRFLFNLFADLKVYGEENLPPGGGFMVCMNHLSRFDAPLGFVLLGPRRMTAFVADTYRTHWFFRRVIQSVDAIWVQRGTIGPSTLKAAIQALHEGRVLGVAPEGTRSPIHALQLGKTGAAALALAANVPIVPLAVTNTENLGDAMKILRRIPITATFGKPFTLPSVSRGERAAKLDEYTTEIMCRIAALLPPHYHGVYAGHPRITELKPSPT